MDELLMRGMPHSAEAEQAVLGSMLIDGDCVKDVMDQLQAEDFYLRQNREIFETIAHMFVYSQPVDGVTVASEMEKNGLYTDATRPYLLQLMEVTPTSANVGEYVKIFRDKALMRQVATAAANITAMVQEGGASAADMLESAEQKVYAIRRGRSAQNMVPVSQILQDVMNRLEELSDSESNLTGLYTGLSAVDSKINGLNHQIELLSNKRNTIIEVNRTAKTALEVFDDLLHRPKMERNDLELMIDRITVYEDHLEEHLQSDIEALLQSTREENVVNFNSGIETSEKCRIVQRSRNQKDKVFDVNVISGGDPLEIYTDRDGEVILKKYSPIGEMSSFAKDYTESLFRSLGHIAVIVDRDQVVAASGLPRKELGDKPISRALETAIASRQTVALNQQSGGRMVAVTTEEDQNPNYTAQVISPIIADGEAIGAVLLMSRDNGVKMGDTELKVAETAAGIVGRQMEQ